MPDPTDAEGGSARVAHLRAELIEQPGRPADLLSEALALSVAEAATRGEFAETLQRHGWALAYVGDRPAAGLAPTDWLEAALDLMDPAWIDPLGQAEHLWQWAWDAGRLAGLAAGRRGAAEDEGAE